MKIFERYKPIIDDWSAFKDAVRQPLPTCIWANTLRTTARDLVVRLQEQGIECEPSSWYAGAFRLSSDFSPSRQIYYWAGLFHVQEEIALLPAVLLAPEPGGRVLDLCAAPGNKTAQIAIMLRNSGAVVANEVNGQRMQPLRQVINRLGLLNVTTTVSDAATFPKQPHQFDRVLVDVVCSCEGTTRKNPSILALEDNPYSLKITRAQTAILCRALQLCKPGGLVAYATCTYAPEENEMVVQAALEAMAPKIQAKIVSRSVPNLRWSPGLSGWNGARFRSDMQNAIRVYPHQNDTGGFFVALIEKNEDTRRESARFASADEPSLHSKLKPVDRDRLLAFVEHRFGIARDSFAGYQLFRTNRKVASIRSREHPLIRHPKIETVGLPFVHINMAQPKLTTAAAQVFGGRATRHHVELDRRQASAFLSRQNTHVSNEQIYGLQSDGHVIVRHDGMILGVGLLATGTRGTELRSLFPKAWRMMS